ncbi:MAG: hemolysin family protein [Hyphomicrobiales bacterium]|nr:hemolysin family protein [Hyphomicrobiales bacterium]
MAFSNNYDEVSSPEKAETGESWIDRLASRVGFSGPHNARAIIAEALRNDTNGSLSNEEQAILQNMLGFKDLRAEDVMVPRGDIVAVDQDTTIAALLGIFAEANHSRLPVYHDTLDKPVGMVHVKDMMGWLVAQGNPEGAKALNLGGADLTKTIADIGIVRELIYVPPSMQAIDLLFSMRNRHIHLALIIDEHGGTDGLVSIEDLLEEVVGDIEDEHDADDEPLLLKADAGALIADARVEIEDIEEKIGLSLDLESYDEVDTLGGLVFTMLGRVPKVGEVLRHPAGVNLEVLDADRRRVKRLRIETSA